MEKYNNIEKEWIAALESGDLVSKVRSIYEIRNSGSVKILPYLMKQINKNTEPEVRNEIINLLSELKSQEAAGIIAEALKSSNYNEYLHTLVAACWQSGLNFSKYLTVFAGLFVKGDYKTALEAFTVIEESLPNALDAEIQDCLQFIIQSECGISGEKFPLFTELRKVIESY